MDSKIPASELKLKIWDILSEAVARGAAYGVRRSFKHTETPEIEAIIDHVSKAVMDEISDFIVWEE